MKTFHKVYLRCSPILIVKIFCIVMTRRKEMDWARKQSRKCPAGQISVEKITVLSYCCHSLVTDVRVPCWKTFVPTYVSYFICEWWTKQVCFLTYLIHLTCFIEVDISPCYRYIILPNHTIWSSIIYGSIL